MPALEMTTPTPDTLKSAIEYFTLPMYEGGPSNLEFLEGVEDRDDDHDDDIDPRTKGSSSRHIDAFIKAATFAINLQERVKELEGAILSAENTLDAARKTFNFYVEEHRKKGSAYDKIKRNEDIRDLCDETLSNLAAVRKK